MLLASVPFGNVAEWGHDWNSGDIASRDQPMAQHVISFTSGSVSVVVFHSGGFSGPVTDVLLTATSSPVYCLFRRVWNDSATMLTLTSLRASAKRHRFSQAESTCRERDDLSPLLR
jgi:hypothetical protein